MKKILFILFVLSGTWSSAQKIDSIYFNLYTDSLKKGVHNYINVDGKLSKGSFLPLMSDEVTFTSSAGKWDGNSIIINRDSTIDSVVITASLKARPEVKKSVTIWIKRSEVDPVLKTEKELIEEWRKQAPVKKRKQNFVSF